MDKVFELLKSQGKTDVESLIAWMKDANVLGNTSGAEERARQLLAGGGASTSSGQGVDKATFMQTVTKLATDNKQNIEVVVKALVAHGPKILKILKAGAAALTGAMGGRGGTNARRGSSTDTDPDHGSGHYSSYEGEDDGGQPSGASGTGIASGHSTIGSASSNSDAE